MKSRGLWIGILLGAPIIAWAIADALGNSDRTKPFELARWIVGAAVVLDLVVIPTAFAVGRLVGDRGRLRWTLTASATLVLVSWPFVRGYGRSSGNPSLLPRNYAVGTVAAVLAVVLVAFIWWAIDHVRRSGDDPAGQ